MMNTFHDFLPYIEPFGQLFRFWSRKQSRYCIERSKLMKRIFNFLKAIYAQWYDSAKLLKFWYDRSLIANWTFWLIANFVILYCQKCQCVQSEPCESGWHSTARGNRRYFLHLACVAWFSCGHLCGLETDPYCSLKRCDKVTCWLTSEYISSRILKCDKNELKATLEYFSCLF